MGMVIHSNTKKKQFKSNKQTAAHIKISPLHFQNLYEQPGNTESFHLILLRLQLSAFV